ncbi:hypothetical protein C10C_0801 [Chlamydia serpentis]|uniref:Uncharacterized protein n=1 Tax=Chlamydia serpentis TaxID=1967782 RepID=A0A2R8FBZ9_9CHLA|nr:hypothetical protein [Chlamydia serpentis]SPN73944.1 hypothetical protein C10C_0801 [Chlamydia serpentis]
MIIQKFANSDELHAWGRSRCHFLYAGALTREPNACGGKLKQLCVDLAVLRTEISDPDSILIGESVGLLGLRLILTLPIINTCFGIGRMCAVWGVKDAKDSICLKIYHTLIAILEILGLGILMLILKILLVIFILPLLYFSSGRNFLVNLGLISVGQPAKQ